MAKPKDLKTLVDLAKTTQTLLTHFQSSLAPAAASPSPSASPADLPNPLDAVKAATTLLKSHTTTLSLLLLTPPLTPSALIAKIGDVSSGALNGMVAAAAYVPQPSQPDTLGNIMRAELRAQVRRLLGTWGDVLALVQRMAEKRQSSAGSKDNGPTESEKQEVLSATGVLWEACDTLLKVCDDGVVGLVVRKAGELRSVLLDAIEELKEWGEDVADEDDDNAEGSDDEDNMFGASNKLGKNDTELKALLDTSVKKLKMVAMLYQALVKRRLKTFPSSLPAAPAPSGQTNGASTNPAKTLDDLMALLKAIPETVDDLASGFYDLDQDEAQETLDKCTTEAKKAAQLVGPSWLGSEDEFTTWSAKWVTALDAA